VNGAQVYAQARAYARAFTQGQSLGRHILDELAQEAACGILHALKRHDPAKGGDINYGCRLWAIHYMKRHMNRMAGPVNHTEHVPPAVTLTGPDTDGVGGHADRRTVDPRTAEGAEFSEALRNADPRTRLMVEAKLAGHTNIDIGEALGVSREWVRQSLAAFLERLDQ
jgi:RNA polymerase sigma factor (sigma-70 family)